MTRRFIALGLSGFALLAAASSGAQAADPPRCTLACRFNSPSGFAVFSSYGGITSPAPWRTGASCTTINYVYNVRASGTIVCVGRDRLPGLGPPSPRLQACPCPLGRR
jgi:hypothetical protein